MDRYRQRQKVSSHLGPAERLRPERGARPARAPGRGSFPATSDRWSELEPIRGELFSVERLELCAAQLAAEHRVSCGLHRGRLLLPRFEENGRRLMAAYGTLAEVVSQGHGASPAAEWVVDNFHSVEEQIRQIRLDLPKSYYHQLPKLADGELQGFPRIYSLALTFIAHTDSRLDGDSLTRFLRAYQQGAPLTIGELWAVAISLRLALIENLQRLTTRLVVARAEREEADALADKLLATPERELKSVVAGVISQLERRPQTGHAFLVQLTQRLRDQDLDVMPLVEWIEREVRHERRRRGRSGRDESNSNEAPREGQSIEELVQAAHHRQAAAQVTVGNIITSMKLISTLDWRKFVESVSLTEPILGADPALAYQGMDFATRDRYRHAIERIARRTRADELAVTGLVLGLAKAAHESAPQDREQAHVGYYLIGEGLEELERAFAYRPAPMERARRAVLAHLALAYFGTLLLTTGAALTLAALFAASAGASAAGVAATVLLALMPAADLCLSGVNWCVTHGLEPRVLPKMDADSSIPLAARTMVVVPTLLTGASVATELIERLEVHYLANQDPQFYFALLTDFGEGSFTGKGLYDVDAFQAALAGRVPGTSLLSHDLFEGLYARTALVSDIELLDDSPAHYDTYAKRQHRWTRGDWQIARWLWPRVPNAENRQVANTLPLISRWKIFDNLRRSLVAPALLLWLTAAWSFLPGSPFYWTLFALAAAGFPVYAQFASALFSPPRDVPWSGYFRHVLSDFAANGKQLALLLAVLPHQAGLSLDAVLRVAYRKLISKKNLLEWMTAAQTEKGSRHDLAAFLRLMYPVSLLAVPAALLISLLNPSAWPAWPFLAAWALSPLIAHFFSCRAPSLRESSRELKSFEQQALRLIARRTWRFFETFVGEEDHWLPDNFQEEPRPLVAHRTSPTNIGLLLLSTVAARDFGYLGLLETVERLESTLATLKKLGKFQGHLCNWYDTTTLAMLEPQYVSTVDSGNLAGHLIALKQSALELTEQALFGAPLLAGLLDGFLLLREEAERLGTGKERIQLVSFKQLKLAIASCFSLIEAMQGAPQELGKWGVFFQELAAHAAEVGELAHALAREPGAEAAEGFAELRFWSAAPLNLLLAARRDFDALLFCSSPALQQTTLMARVAPQFAARRLEAAASFTAVPSVAQVAEGCRKTPEEIGALSSELAALEIPERPALLSELAALSAAIEVKAQGAAALLRRTTLIAKACDRLVEAMDFRFLFDAERKLFVIGYNVSDGRRDNALYDLLASESRLTSLVAIAKGDAPQEHWFRLGRQLTQVDGAGRALVLDVPLRAPGALRSNLFPVCHRYRA